MTTFKRTLVILLVSLLLGVGVWLLADTAWAANYADSVVAANQAAMDAAYTATSGATVTGRAYFATGGNLLRIVGIGAAVIVAATLLDGRKG